MDFQTLVATISLFLQIAVLLMLFGSLVLKGKKKFRQHGIAVLFAVVLHTISILAVMISSFFALTLADFPVPVLVSTIAYIHGITGIVAEVFGVWIIATWRLRTSLKYCASKKRWMRLTLVSWLIALFSGILIYLYFYTTLLTL
ncbi:MAG: hypothetical protein NWE80_01750 [Candidatus Bathyarchaeota archaeon]|nr:hypothetical protein [Candidatus Bathyarchaeota archaeon]